MDQKTKNKIEIVRYNPEWPKMFEFEASRIREALGHNCLAVHHVGSTSIPHLVAKDRLDIIAVVTNPADAIAALETLGFTYKGEYNIPFHYGFSKRGARNINLQVYQEGHAEIEVNLTFRDYLRTYGAVRDNYARLKLQLVKSETAAEKNNDSLFSEYTLKKGAFIHEVLKKAELSCLRVLKCNGPLEWETAKLFRQEYFEALGQEDTGADTFNQENHQHFVLCYGVDIFGYAHVELLADAKAALRIFMVDDIKKNQSFAGKFLTVLEKWLKAQNYKVLSVQASVQAVPFYEKNRYFADSVEGDLEKKSNPSGVLMEKVLF